MRKTTFLVIFILVVTTGVFYFIQYHKKSDIRNYPSSGSNIVAFGDSLTFGLGSTEGNDYVSVLSSKVGQPFINLGVSGDTTEEALKRIDDVLSKDPKVVIVLLGGNDALRQVPLQATFNNLETIILKIQNKGAVVLLLGIQGGLIGDKYKASFENLSEKYHTAYVPNVLEGIIGHSDLMYDGVHPNDKGYQIIADRIYPILLPLIK